MTLRLPGLTQTISLDDMSNAVAVRHTNTDFSVNPPTTSGTAVTGFATDADSIAIYQSKEEVLQRGRLDTAMAEQEANTWLAEFGWPKARKRTSTSNNLRLDVTIKGYWHTTDFRTYNQTVNSGKQNADVQIKAVSDLVCPYVDSVDLESNTFQVNEYYDRPDEIRKARDIMEEIAGFGDTSENRWVVGVKENRTLYYREATKDLPTYWRRTTDPAHWVRDVERGHIVEPWLVRPDNVLRTADVNPLGGFGTENWREDPQLNYIESVEWTEPYGLVMTDSRGQRIEALMARNVAKGDELFRREFA